MVFALQLSPYSHIIGNGNNSSIIYDQIDMFPTYNISKETILINHVRCTWYCNLNVVYEPFTINLKLVMKNWFIIVVMLSKKMQAILFNVRKNKIKSHWMRYVIHINIYFIFYSWCHSKWLIIVEARPKFHVIVNICSTFL